MEAWKKMSLFMELMWDHLCILIKREKDVLILGEGPTQGLDNTTLTAEAIYLINIHSNKRFVSGLHYNRSNSLFVNATKIYPLKAKNSEIKVYALCLGNISKDFTINIMKKKQDYKEL